MAYNSPMRIALLVAVCLLAAGTAASQESRYTAALAGGRRITGGEVTDWGSPGAAPKLSNQPLLGAGNPILWLSDTTLAAPPVPDAFVEFVNSDRLPGKILEGQDNRRGLTRLAAADYLSVEVSVPLKGMNNERLSQVRVVGKMVRRIVWKRMSLGHYRPGTLFGLGGQRIAFDRCRFLAASVQLLTPAGIQEIPFRDVAELHLPRVDPWHAYYDELAALSPDLKSRLFQLETTTGLIATSSALRFLVPAYVDAAKAETWYHLIQPAWSLDAFAVRHHQIRMRRYFAPHEVPLSRIAPLRAVNHSALHSGRRWQVNRSVYGRPLEAGKPGYGWGFGVHGHSELTFPLPPHATAFRTQFKLDRTAGGGGCVRGVVTLSAGDPQDRAADYGPGEQIYRSDVLIGSASVLQTGNLPLKRALENERRLLTLSVDPVHQDRPPGADPLDIRDVLNWLEPTVVLERKALQAEIDRAKIRAIVAWEGWAVKDADKVPLRLLGRWETTPEHGTAYRFAVLAGRPLTLSRTITLGPKQKWLILAARLSANETARSSVEVRIDGTPIARYDVPMPSGASEEPRPLVIPLTSHSGRKVVIDIEQRPTPDGARNAAVDWRTIAFVERLPMLREVFEDAGQFVPANEPENNEPATAEVMADGAYSGTSCVKITPGGRFRIDLGETPVPIRKQPKWGEYRYVRFAFRKNGQGHLGLELEPARQEAKEDPAEPAEQGEQAEQEKPDREPQTLRYFAGRGDSPTAGARRVWIWSTHADLPDAWIVVTRDLYGDFGGFTGDVSSLTLSCTGGSDVLFDHIYLGRTPDDFELVQVPRIATPRAAALAARRVMAKTTLDKALPAVVLIQDGQRSYSGVIVAKDGLVLTVGHTTIRPRRDVTVVLADGRQVKGQTLGIDRANDTAMVKITDGGEYPSVELAAPVEDIGEELLLGVAHPSDFKPGGPPLADLMWLRGEMNGRTWMDYRVRVLGCGGPLLIAAAGAPQEGKLIAVHTGRAWDGFLYTPIAKYQESWDRLVKGEAWGQWGPGAGPLLGVYPAEGDGGCKISQIVPDGPAAKAGLKTGDVIKTIDGQNLGSNQDLTPILSGKDPGQEVQVQLDRAGKTLDVNVILGGRK